jgi:hypothetical protein
VQTIYENVRSEALHNLESPSWALERIRRYGVAGLFPGAQEEFPFILYAQSVPRLAWSGKRDFQRERLHQVYKFLTQEVREDVSRPVGMSGLGDTAAVACERVADGSLEGLYGQEAGWKSRERLGYNGLRLGRPGDSNPGELGVGWELR